MDKGVWECWAEGRQVAETGSRCSYSRQTPWPLRTKAADSLGWPHLDIRAISSQVMQTLVIYALTAFQGRYIVRPFLSTTPPRHSRRSISICLCSPSRPHRRANVEPRLLVASSGTLRSRPWVRRRLCLFLLLLSNPACIVWGNKRDLAVVANFVCEIGRDANCARYTLVMI